VKPLVALLLASFLLAGAGATPMRRSAGYAGSTPDGLNGNVAFASFDCVKINRDPRRSRLRVPLSSDCAVFIPSPDGRALARGSPDGDGIALHVTGGLVVKQLQQPITLLWSPRSDAFLLNDGEGSGQTSKLRYFARRGDGWHESRRLHEAAERLFLRRQHCRRGAYANVSGMGWNSRGELRATVQEGVHSEGCLQPRDGNLALEVVGDPWTGKIRLARARVDR
jgi:hypothetical protein